MQNVHTLLNDKCRLLNTFLHYNYGKYCHALFLRNILCILLEKPSCLQNRISTTDTLYGGNHFSTTDGTGNNNRI